MIPLDRIDTLFLDVGNTLVSIDFDRVAEALSQLGAGVEVETLRRAEAASRPAISKRLAVRPWPERDEPFVVYLKGILAQLDRVQGGSDGQYGRLAGELAPVLRGERASDLWRSVMPRVPEALVALERLGLTLTVVSNSDGTAEEMLVDAGLRHHFNAVVDSAIVGYEKPDPRIFEHALRLSGARPETTLHVGDLYDADVVGARGAGLHALLLDPYGDWSDIDCDMVEDLWTLAARLDHARRLAGWAPESGPPATTEDSGDSPN